MNNVWERFDSIVTPEEVNEVKVKFTPLAEGEYDVILEEIAPTESTNGLPMLSCKFRTVDGNRVIFFNHFLQNMNYPDMNGRIIAEAVTFVSGILEEEIEFTGLGAFAELITSIPIGTYHRVSLTYRKTDYDKKFPKLKIVDKVEPPKVDGFQPDGDDIPF